MNYTNRHIHHEDREIIEKLESLGFICSSMTFTYLESYNSRHKTKITPDQVPDLLNLPKMVKSHPTRLENLRIQFQLDANGSVKSFPNMPKTLPSWISKLEHLLVFSIDEAPLEKFEGLPDSIEYLHLRLSTFNSLQAINAPWHNLKEFTLGDCPNLLSLEGGPKELPNLTHLTIERCGLQTLEGAPKMPKLNDIKIQECPVKNYAGYDHILENSPSLYPFGIISFNISSIISLFGIPQGIFKKKTRKYMNRLKFNLESFGDSFPQSYLSYLDFKRWTNDQIYQHFQTDPTQLAVKYANQDELSQFDLDRIVHEGTPQTIRTLRQLVPPTDPILQQLTKRWNVSLEPDPVIL